MKQFVYWGSIPPEIKQPYGIESSNHLSKLIKDKNIHVIAKKRDKYGRLLGKVFLIEEDVNLKMVETGNAHWFLKYKYEQSFIEKQLYKKKEQQAKINQLGLWKSTNVLLPSEWRSKNKKTKKNQN